MKKLKPKDLMLSPRVVTDLTGNGTGNSNGAINHPNQISDEGDQCLSEVDNRCANDDIRTGGTCIVTRDNTCKCTEVCPETQSDNEQCCEVSDDIRTNCCITPPVTIEICPETEYETCPKTIQCEETEFCPVDTNFCPQ